MKEYQKSEIDGWNRAIYQELLNQWVWEWFLTARLVPRVPREDPAIFLKEFRTKLLRQEGGQVGSMGIFVNGEDGPHIHVLMIGRFPGGRTLRDIDAKLWSRKMSEITRNSCKIYQVDEENNRVNYVVKWKNTPEGHHELLTPWGRILEKTKIWQSSGPISVKREVHNEN
ncbi:MAG: hypothetical protein ABSB79_11250 [Syntrophales bacterium]|jgi:hypothetical protein